MNTTTKTTLSKNSETGLIINLPDPEGGSQDYEMFNWKLQQALYHLKDTRQSKNPYNNKELLTALLNCEVLCSDTLEWPCNGYQFMHGPAPGRADKGLDESVIFSLSKTLPITGFYDKQPIILDREWRVLDGLNRLYVCKKFEIQYSWIKINF